MKHLLNSLATVFVALVTFASCHEYGAYRVRADFYYKGNNISFNYIIAVATGSPTY